MDVRQVSNLLEKCLTVIQIDVIRKMLPDLNIHFSIHKISLLYNSI